MTTFVWGETPIDTIRELLNAADDAELDGQEFLSVYRAVNDGTNANLGCLTGYIDDEGRQRLYAAFNLTSGVRRS